MVTQQGAIQLLSDQGISEVAITVPEGKLATPRNSADVALYNQIALKVMTEHGVAIDDLNAAITPHLAKLQRPHDVHYTAEGSAALGQAVVKSLEKELGK